MDATQTDSRKTCPPQARPLCPGEEPPLAAHLVSPRGLYVHHGLYAGHGRVIHYAGRAHGLRGGVIREDTLERFARGRGIFVRGTQPTHFAGEAALERARSRLGENRYHLFNNNCEHFCEWCLHGRHRSAQVDAWRARPRRALRMTRHAVSRWLIRAVRTGRSCAPTIQLLMTRLTGAAIRTETRPFPDDLPARAA